MPHSYGKRAQTRDLFSRPFRAHGLPGVSVGLVNFKVGDYVDIKVNSSIQKGMPYKFYHGRTGVIFDVKKRAVGVIVNKKVGNRCLPKRIHVRIEHVVKSLCRDDFLTRSRDNDRIKREAKEKKEKVPSTKRPMQLPRDGFFVNGNKATVETFDAPAYTEIW